MTPRDVRIERARPRACSCCTTAACSIERPRVAWRAAGHDPRVASIATDSDERAAAGFSGWVDEQGRIVLATQLLGFDARASSVRSGVRELEGRRARSVARAVSAIATSTRRRRSRRTSARRELTALRVALTRRRSARLRREGLSPATARRHAARSLARRRRRSRATYALPERREAVDDGACSSTPSRCSRVEQSGDRRARARDCAARETDPRVVAERINQWVYDSLQKTITFGVPSALQTLRAARRRLQRAHAALRRARARRGDSGARRCRSRLRRRQVLLPRLAGDLAGATGSPSIPTFGQFPADAAHLRFTVGGLGTPGGAASSHGSTEDRRAEGLERGARG